MSKCALNNYEIKLTLLPNLQNPASNLVHNSVFRIIENLFEDSSDGMKG